MSQTTPTQQPAGDGGRPGTSSPAAPAEAAEAAPAPEEQPRVPALPEPPRDGDAPVTNLSVGGEGVRLDHLGPLVVNQDGTMSRISNWDAMSEIERQNTLRILGKRNQLRLKKLRDDAGVSAEEPASGSR